MPDIWRQTKPEKAKTGNEIREAFPQRLQRLREKRQISRRVLSELCGLSKNAVAKYERGEAEPNMASLIALADYFGVTTDYLACRNDRRE